MLFYGPQEAWGQRTRREVERHPNFPKLLTTFRAMKKTADRMKVRIAIIILPTKGKVYRQVLSPESPAADSQRSGFGEAVLSACEQISLACWDSKPYLREEARRLFAASKELLWWRDDTHINDSGHQALAEFLEKDILGNGTGSLMHNSVPRSK